MNKHDDKCGCYDCGKKRIKAIAVENNRFVYHYSSHYQVAIGSIAYIDGIAQMTERIINMDGYSKLKELIYSPDPDKLTIDSLSFLGKEKGL